MLDLDVAGSRISYVRPEWYLENGFTEFEIIKSNTTPADTFVEIGLKIGSSLEDKIQILLDHGATEINEADFLIWEKVKQMIMVAQEAKRISENPPEEV